jgi:hypothetical protein
MSHNKMNGSTPTLDARIASTLASDVVDKDELTALLHEAEQALAEAQETITTESENALDLANSDPDASDVLVRKAQRTSTRLNIAIPKLRDRIKSIAAYEYREAWHSEADAVNARSVLSAERLKHYAKFIVWLQAEFVEIDDINAEIHQLHARAPSGEDRRLIEPELIARGIDRYDAAHPRLREQLKLPEFIKSSVIAYPRDALDEWNRHAVQMNEAMRQRIAMKGALVSGDNWHAGRELQIEQEEAAFAQRAEELKAAETKSKVEFEAKLQDAERRRLTGE